MSLPRIELFEVLFPLPQPLPSVAELASFKRQHQIALCRLRKKTEAHAAAIASAPTPDGRAVMMAEAREQLEEEIGVVVEALKSRWKVVLLGGGLAALPVGWGLGQALDNAVPVGAAMSAVSAALAIHQAMARARANDKVVSGSPLAYAGAFQSKFSRRS